LSTQSSKFESILAKHPKLRANLAALASYIGRQVEAGRTDIVPALAAAGLKISESEILGLLMLFEKQGLVKPIYQIYCAEKKTLLAEVDSKDDISEVVYCKYCDKEHRDPDEFEVELVFRAVNGVWEAAPQNVAVS
jgi:hypothetical protein